MVPYSAYIMKRFGIQATFGKSLKDVCYIVSRLLSIAILNSLRVCVIPMSNIVKNFNYSRKLRNVVNVKLKLNTVLQVFVFISLRRRPNCPETRGSTK